VNNENKNLLKIKDCLSPKNKYKIKIKLWQSALISMLLNLFSLNHGCEQQIPKNKSFMLLSNICCPLTFCRGGIIKKEKKRERARSSVHNSNFNTMLRGPKVRKMHDVQAEHVQSFALCRRS